jgi:acylphosphatase
MSLIARRALVSGQVQGVGFRHHTKVHARELGLTGWVRNLPDGTVEALIEGPESAVDSMITWLQRGPPASRVSKVAVESAQLSHPERFVVRFD